MDDKSSARSRVVNKLSGKKIAANRANAQRSTGPRTEQGKARSKLNSLKHGLLASEAVTISVEGEAAHHEFEALCDSLEQEHEPRTPTEELLVQKFALAAWRLRRLVRFEQKTIFDAKQHEDQMIIDWPIVHEGYQWHYPINRKKAGLDGLRIPGAVDMACLTRYDAAFNRDFYRSLGELRKMRKERAEVEELDEVLETAEDPAAAEPASEDGPSRPEKKECETNPPTPEMKSSESHAKRTEDEDSGGGTSSG